MESYYLDWANLLLRWVHVITAIAWIGASFYFVMLDNSLEKPHDQESLDKGVGGEQWAVHGGGFYNMQKYALAPKKLPDHLHWSYWESYSTWLSGFALFTMSYLWNASTYLIDKSKMDWQPGAAISVALAFFVVFWIAYDCICQIFGRRKNGDTIVGVLVALLVAFAAWLACQWFAGRAAFLLVGAMMATTMSGNVFFWIIPGQRENVAALREGKPVNPAHGIRGKQRSVHNTYFTLPVLIAMLSNHYGFLTSHPRRWLVLCLLMAAGALIRQFFVQRHGWHHGRARHPWPFAAAGVLVLLGLIAWMKPAPVPASAALPASVGYAQIAPVLAERCVSCHGEAVQMKNLRLDSQAQVEQHAQLIYQQVVVSRIMPLSNGTHMTDAERALVARWFEGRGRAP